MESPLRYRDNLLLHRIRGLLARSLIEPLNNDPLFRIRLLVVQRWDKAKKDSLSLSLLSLVASSVAQDLDDVEDKDKINESTLGRHFSR